MEREVIAEEGPLATVGNRKFRERMVWAVSGLAETCIRRNTGEKSGKQEMARVRGL